MNGSTIASHPSGSEDPSAKNVGGGTAACGAAHVSTPLAASLSIGRPTHLPLSPSTGKRHAHQSSPLAGTFGEASAPPLAVPLGLPAIGLQPKALGDRMAVSVTVADEGAEMAPRRSVEDQHAQIAAVLLQTSFALKQYCSSAEVERLLQAPQGFICKADDLSILETLCQYGTEQSVGGQKLLSNEIEYVLKNNVPSEDGHFRAVGPALSKLSRVVRHSVLEGVAVDIDQVQAGASILYAFAAKHGLDPKAPSLWMLVEHREATTSRLMIEAGPRTCPDEAAAKELIHQVMHSATCHSEAPFLNKLHREIRQLLESLLALAHTGEHVQQMGDDDKALVFAAEAGAVDSANRLGSILARICSYHSRRLTTVVMWLLQRDGHQVIAYENDGCQILQTADTADIALSLAEHSATAAQLCCLPSKHIRFVVKPMSGKLSACPSTDGPRLGNSPASDGGAAPNSGGAAAEPGDPGGAAAPDSDDDADTQDDDSDKLPNGSSCSLHDDETSEHSDTGSAASGVVAAAAAGGCGPAAGIGATGEGELESLSARVLREQPKIQCDPQTQQQDAAKQFLKRYGSHIKFDGTTGFIRIEKHWVELSDKENNSLQGLVQNINFYIDEKKSLISTNSGVVGISAMICRQAYMQCQHPGFIQLAHQSVKAKVKQRHECCFSSVLWWVYTDPVVCWQLCFSNGVLDMRTKEWHDWTTELLEDIHTFKIISRQHEASTPADIAFLRNLIFENAFTLPGAGVGSDEHAAGQEQAEFMAQVLARAMAGHVEDKRSIINVGPRNSGKGLLADFVCSSFGGADERGYYGVVHTEQFVERHSPAEPAKANQWMHQHNGKRILVQNEAPDSTSNRKLCSATFKGNTSGGDPMLIRLNHQEAKTIYPTHAIMLNVNEVPEFTNVDSFECIDIFRCEPGWLAAQGIDWLTPTSVLSGGSASTTTPWMA